MYSDRAGTNRCRRQGRSDDCRMGGRNYHAIEKCGSRAGNNPVTVTWFKKKKPAPEMREYSGQRKRTITRNQIDAMEKRKAPRSEEQRRLGAWYNDELLRR